MAYQYLMAGEPWSSYKEELSRPRVSTEDIEPPTEDDILASWILGKDEEMG